MTQLLPSFQQYQQEFCAHLRDPLCNPRPKNVPVVRMAVYKEIVFNNLFESVSACFPVAQKTLGKRAWISLCKSFIREHSANSPIFREIPEEFLQFIGTQSNLPEYLSCLCHYEWVELKVSLMPDNLDKKNIEVNGCLLRQQPAFNPAMQLLNYDYAVHKISARHKPKAKANTQLLVYRDLEDNVKFIELNPVTHRLITLLQQNHFTGEFALKIIAEKLNHPQPESIIQFGMEMLENLRTQGVIVGTYRL